MSIEHGSRPFRKTLLSSICIAYLSGHSIIALADDESKSKTTRYLDPAIGNIVVDENQCFKAPPRSIFTVEPIGVAGSRTYKVSQYFDRDVQRTMYAVPLDDQIQQRKIVATKFCKGIASISDMSLPFTKGDGIDDANDGLLLVEKTRHGVVDIMKQLNEMSLLAAKASSGTYSSSQLSNLDIEFQAHMATIQHVVNNARFNGVALFDGSNGSIAIPIDRGDNAVVLALANLTTGSAGLNIDMLNVRSDYEAQNALSTLSSMTAPEAEISELKAAKIQLSAAAKRNAVTTFVDERTDDFFVQKEGPKGIKGGRPQ